MVDVMFVIDVFYDRADLAIAYREREFLAGEKSRRAPYYFTIPSRDGIAQPELTRRVVVLDGLRAERDRLARTLKRPLK